MALVSLLLIGLDHPQVRAENLAILEADIITQQQAMASGSITSEWLIRRYLERLDRYSSRLVPALAVDRAGSLRLARQRDRERRQGRLRGPLHGIPIALKDIIQTVHLPTTGGALALQGWRAPFEATLVRRLRTAGAIVLAKTTLTELGNWVSDSMPDGFNALAGPSYSPYDSRRDPREGFRDGRAFLDPGGSSSGIGTAASLWSANVGEETFGSIQIPSVYNSLVGIRPTQGRISRHGLIPISRDQDTPGPMARSVRDAALLLEVMQGPDPDDPQTGVCPDRSELTAAIQGTKADLGGLRIGIPRAFFYEPLQLPGDQSPRGGLDPRRRHLMRQAISDLEDLGAEVVDPTDLPSVIAADRDDNLLLFPPCASGADRRGDDQNCSVVMKYGMKRDFNAWLKGLGRSAPLPSLTALRQFNLDHRARSIPYGQTLLDISDEMDLEADAGRYRRDRAKDIRLARTEGIDAALRRHQLDALLFPGWSSETVVNRAGYPAVVVPIGLMAERPSPPLPPGVKPSSRPFGMAFVGTACSEPTLLRMAAAYEHVAGGRVAPTLP